MKYLFIILSLMGTQQKDIYIAVDNSLKSKVVQYELERDWTKFQGPKTLENIMLCSFIQAKQNKFKEHFRIHWETNAYPKKFPAVRFRKNASWEYYPERSFQMTTYPLLCTIWMANTHYIEHIYQKNEELCDNYYTQWFQKYASILEFVGLGRGYVSAGYFLATGIWAYDDKEKQWIKILSNSEGFKDANELVEYFKDTKPYKYYYVENTILVGIDYVPYNMCSNEKYYFKEPIRIKPAPFPYVDHEPPLPWEKPYKYFPENKK